MNRSACFVRLDAAAGSHRLTMKPATSAALQAQAREHAQLPFDAIRDHDDVRRGILGTLPDAHILTERGDVAWSMRPHAFLISSAL